ncbi:hypothetical protein [Falsiroseomonas sp. E2-1-a20]|uniref:hypothetical protein n=1 Tax=Falsiroseomonas sp. E2-1-a20 TaxID=3239300 RepID=UPI003F2CAA2F
MPRFSGASRRLLLEGQRTNAVRNPRGDDSPTPTNWQVFNFPSGVVASFVGTGVEDGIPFVDLQITGTPAGGSTSAGWSPESVAAIAASPGQTWTSSLFCRLGGGSLTNLGLSWGFQDRDQIDGGMTQWITPISPTAARLERSGIPARPRWGAARLMPGP